MRAGTPRHLTPHAGMPGERRPVVEVPIDHLVETMSPRLTNLDLHHVRALAENLEDLPPILVHRETRAVVDGTHRLMAARLRGRGSVRVEFFDGSELEAFVEAVRQNTTHGKALTLGERKHAARQMLSLMPERSDRAVAEICGLSSKTVAGIRSRGVGPPSLPPFRVGRDGRRRPTDPTRVRLEVADLLRKQPEASARAVAAAVATSQATVLDVRRRLARGESPAPGRPPDGPCAAAPGPDSALAATADGRSFARWFDATRIAPDRCLRFADAVPRGRVYLVADEARARAAAWARFADLVEARAGGRRT